MGMGTKQGSRVTRVTLVPRRGLGALTDYSHYLFSLSPRWPERDDLPNAGVPEGVDIALATASDA